MSLFSISANIFNVWLVENSQVLIFASSSNPLVYVPLVECYEKNPALYIYVVKKVMQLRNVLIVFSGNCGCALDTTPKVDKG